MTVGREAADILTPCLLPARRRRSSFCLLLASSAPARGWCRRIRSRYRRRPNAPRSKRRYGLWTLYGESRGWLAWAEGSRGQEAAAGGRMVAGSGRAATTLLVTPDVVHGTSGRSRSPHLHPRPRGQQTSVPSPQSAHPTRGGGCRRGRRRSRSWSMSTVRPSKSSSPCQGSVPHSRGVSSLLVIRSGRLALSMSSKRECAASVRRSPNACRLP
jgi:hypothetical protein